MDIVDELRGTQRWADDWRRKMRVAADEIDRLRAELAVAKADLAVSVGHLSRLAAAYGCEDFTAAVDAALAAKGE